MNKKERENELSEEQKKKKEERAWYIKLARM